LHSRAFLSLFGDPWIAGSGVASTGVSVLFCPSLFRAIRETAEYPEKRPLCGANRCLGASSVSAAPLGQKLGAMAFLQNFLHAAWAVEGTREWRRIGLDKHGQVFSFLSSS